jgi:hypothetical protein
VSVCCSNCMKHANEDYGAICGLFLLLGLGCTTRCMNVVSVAVIMNVCVCVSVIDILT